MDEGHPGCKDLVDKLRNHDIRLGVIVPPGNVSIEREFRHFAPENVGVHFNRLSRPISISTSESLLSMLDSLERAAVDLAQCHPQLMLFGCTSGSFLGGEHDDEKIGNAIQDYTGIPGITASAAVVHSLKKLGVRRCFMLTPYPDNICLEEVTFLKGHGIEVVGWTSFRCMKTEQTLAISTEQVAAKLREHRSAISSADGIFISCTNLLTMDVLPVIENEFGVPAVSSNQAMLFAALATLRVDARNVPAGRLFQLHGHLKQMPEASFY